MNDRLHELKVFVRAAESGSFSRAAGELGLTQPSVSRIVSELEERLGVRLLLRTTRRITLTDAGSTLLGRARQLFADLDEAEDAARGIDSLQGVVRLAVPVLYGTVRIVPLLPLLLEQHPGLHINLTVTDHYQDLVADGVDVAIRTGRLADSSMGARKLENLERYVVAAPSYLSKYGVPKTPADLSDHNCIVGPSSLDVDGWVFSRGGTVTSVKVHGRLQTRSLPGTVVAAVVGIGVALTSNVAAGEPLRNGSLVRLLKDYETQPVEVHAVFPQGPRPSSKVRAVVDFLAKHMVDGGSLR